MAPADPTPAALDLAERVLAQLPTRPLFARIDLVPSPEGKPLLIELELVEPVLFFEQGPAAATRLARAIRRDERLG